jgi:hypothetical protein
MKSQNRSQFWVLLIALLTILFVPACATMPTASPTIAPEKVVGKWEGKWGGRRLFWIIIEKVNGNTIELRYKWTATASEEAGEKAHTAKITSEKSFEFSIPTYDGRATYATVNFELQDYGVLKATFHNFWKNEKSFATLFR